MNKILLIGTIFVSVIFLGPFSGFAQPMDPGMMGPGDGYGASPGRNWNYCPYCGSYTGPGGYGRMGPGYGMGPGMMGGMMGYGMMPGMMGGPMMRPGYGYGPPDRPPEKSVDKETARQEVENYLASLRNPNLKIGKVEEKDNEFVVGIVTKDGSLVDNILVDKHTGWMRSLY